MKKINLLFVAILVVFSLLTLTACDEEGVVGSIEKVDHTKTQLYVYNYDGGYGQKWLNEVKGRFESAYVDYEGKDGKVGVQVLIENGKNDGGKLLDDINNNRNEIIFTENVSYYLLYVSPLPIHNKTLYALSDTTPTTTIYNFSLYAIVYPSLCVAYTISL